GSTTPRPAQCGHAQVGMASRSAPNNARPDAVSCAGRSNATTSRFLSSPQIDATIGTGRRAARLSRRVETGSRRTSASTTARTPAAPSTSPTSLATSRKIASVSANGPRDARDTQTNRPELGADDLEHLFAPDVAVGEQVDVCERELRPGVDAQMRLREDVHARDRAVRKDAEPLAEHRRAASVRAGIE